MGDRKLASRGRVVRAAALASAALLAACGSGTAALVSGSGGGSGNAAPALSGFRVEDAKTTPATVRFVLADEEGDPARVELYYALQGAPARPLTALAPGASNPASYATSPGGVEHRIEWRFTDEPDLPADGSYLEGLEVFALVEGGQQELVAGTNAATGGVGNDAPVVEQAVVPASGEVAGTVGVVLTVRDTSDDVVAVRVEYDLLDDAPDAGWRTARPALADETPDFALPDLLASRQGTSAPFFWDTDVDLAEAEHDVRLRFTAVDRDATGAFLAEGPPLESAAFRVDNNAAPVAVLAGESLQLSGDATGGIPVPFEVRDEEADEVLVVVQWRRPGEAFPELPGTRAEIDAALADEGEREVLRVARELPVRVHGHVDAARDGRAVLRELGGVASQLVHGGLEGRTLELYRRTLRPLPLAARWAAKDLVAPVGAAPLGDGLEALVLDRPSAGAWRLRRMEPASGATSEVVASGAGEPEQLALDPLGGAAYVATSLGRSWTIARLDLETGARSELFTSGAELPPAPLGGLLPLGERALLVTCGDRLLRLSVPETGPAFVATVLEGLHAPRGLALDPFDRRTVYLAERDAPVPGGRGRVLAVDVARRTARPYAASAPDGGPAFPRARAVAPLRERGGLLVLCDASPGDGESELRYVPLPGLELPETSPYAIALPDGVSSCATGPRSLVLLSDASADELLAGGGLEQRRVVASYEPAGNRLAPTVPFAPPPVRGQEWALPDPGGSLRASPEGERGQYVWDSRQATYGSQVFFRVTPYDSERGSASESVAATGVSTPPRSRSEVLGDASGDLVELADVDGDGRVDAVAAGLSTLGGSGSGGWVELRFGAEEGGFEGAPVDLTDRFTPVIADLEVADVDGNGLLDLVVTSEADHHVQVLFQEQPRQFAQDVYKMGNGLLTTEPRDAVVADVDGDGLADVVSANRGNHTLTVFRQVAPRRFDLPNPTVLGGWPETRKLDAVEAADLDGDGDVDLVGASVFTGELFVFWQDEDGAFPSERITKVTGLPVDPDESARHRLRALDVDGDGDLDLTTATAFRSALVLQAARGAFEAPLSVASRGLQLAWADFEGDGDQDPAWTSSALQVALQTSPGAFSGTTFLPMALELERSPVDARNLDGDGTPDYLVGGGVLVRVPAKAAFALGPLEFGGPGSNDFLVPEQLLDWNEDGLLDGFRFGQGSLQVAPRVFEPTQLDVPGPYLSERIVDLDSDGLLDVIGTRSTSPFTTGVAGVRFAYREADGTYPDPGDAPTWTCPACADQQESDVTYIQLTSVFDLEGDGDLDVAFQVLNYGSVEATVREVVLRQVRPRHFEEVLARPLEPANPGRTTRLEDVDGDGRSDLVQAAAAPDRVECYLQGADGTFSETPLIVPLELDGHPPSAFFVADVDRDGRADVCAAALGTPRVSVSFQVRDLEFECVPLTGAALSAVADAPSVVDLDRDGWPELLLGGGAGGPLVWRQDAPRRFGEARRLVPDVQVGAVGGSTHIADLDGDGALDVVQSVNVDGAQMGYWGVE